MGSRTSSIKNTKDRNMRGRKMTLKRINVLRLLLSIVTISSFIFSLWQGPLNYRDMPRSTLEQSLQRWTGSLLTHAPIRITSNANFTYANGISGGAGTPISPWIIENWMVFGEGENSCIYITNTTEYFIIRHCSLWEAPTNRSHAGIVLQNVTNARLEDNNCYSNSWCGIFLSQSNGNVIQDNWCWDNYQGVSISASAFFGFLAGFGIYLDESNSNFLINNNCSNNQIGIVLNASQNNSLQQNTIQNNIINIFMDNSNNNRIIANAGGNSNYAIWFNHSNSNTAEKNLFRNMNIPISLHDSNGNTIRDNKIWWSGYNYCIFSDGEQISANNDISVISPFNLGYFYGGTGFSSLGVIGWIFIPITIISWIYPLVNERIFVPLRCRFDRVKKKRKYNAMSSKADSYKQLEEEHQAVISQLTKEAELKKYPSRGD